MNLPTPFAYPTTPHARRHGPRGYKNYQDYKPFLRDDFTFRCVYCLERETWYPNRDASFSVDHFEPKVLNPPASGNTRILFTPAHAVIPSNLPRSFFWTQLW